jgi:hypothetical protein
VLAGSALVCAFVLPGFRSPSGVLTGAFIVPLAFAAGLLLIAAFATRARLRFLLWLTLLLVGQACALQLIRAGHGVGYQHFVTWSELVASGQRIWMGILVLQAVLVAGALPWAITRLNERLVVRPAAWRVAAVLAVIFGAGAAASRDVVLYGGELTLAFLIQALAIGHVIVLVMALPDEALDRVARLLDRLLGPVEDSAGGFWRLDRFVVVAAVWAIGVTAVLGIVAYQWHPHVPDEVVYLLHAKYLAAGQLDLPLPPVPDAFSIDLMTYEATRWYSPVPPGWPFVLSLGALLGVPWLVNPVLSGLCVIGAFILVRELYGPRTARVTTLLLCTSPWFLFLGMSLMTHQLTLTAALLAAVGAARLRRGGSLGFGLVAGAGIGMLALIRPLEGLVAAVLLGFWVLLSGPLRRRIIPVGVMAAASIATAAVTLPYNAYYTGDPTVFPIMAYTDALYGPGSNALGFGPDRGLPFGPLDPFPGHGLADAAVNSVLNVFQVNVELLGWMTGSIVLIAFLLVSRRVRRTDVWMLVVIAAVVGVHAFYWFSGGPDFGARYWYLILLPCLVLVARGVDSAAGAFREVRDGARPALGLLALCFASITVFVPWRAADKYFHYRSMRPDVRTLIDDNGMEGDLVLVRGARMPDYMSAVPYGALLQGDSAPIIAWDRDDSRRRAILEAYPDRDVWIIEGPTLNGDGYRVVSGPTPARDLMESTGGT